MGFDYGSVATGYGVVMTAFFIAWVVGLAARAIEWGGED